MPLHKRPSRMPARTATILLLLSAGTASAAGSLQYLGGSSFADGVTYDGSVIVGQIFDNRAGEYRPYRYTEAGGLQLLTMPERTLHSGAHGVSYDGSVIVGSANFPSTDISNTVEAFRWTQAGGVQRLGQLGGGYDSNASAVSGDGKVIVGGAVDGTSLYEERAFRWTQPTGMQSLGTLSGGRRSKATAVNVDGSVVVGWSEDGSPSRSDVRAFRWTAATGMQGLGTPPDAYASYASGVSADGAIVVGWLAFGAPGVTHTSQAFRWTQATGVQALLPGARNSSASAISANGKVIVGSVDTPQGGSFLYRWTERGGMQSIADWLRANGVTVGTELGGLATAVNADGSVIVGQAARDSRGSEYDPFIARVSTPGSGLISIPEFMVSLSSAGGTPSMALDVGALVLHGAHGHPLSRRVQPGKNCFWTSGDWGRDDHGARDGSVGLAEVGACRSFTPTLQAGLALGKTRSRQDRELGSGTDLDGTYLLAEIIGALPGDRLWATLTGYHHRGDADIRRGYLNAGTPDVSFGTTDTRTSGASLRIDLENAAEIGRLAITPYAKLSYTRTRIDRYSETAGGFPASYDGRSEHSTEARLGVNAAMSLGGKTRLVTSLEGVNRFEKNGARTSGQVIGLFGFDLPGQELERNWLHASAGIEQPIGPGVASLFVNATTRGQDPNFWAAASYQVTF